MDGHIVVFGCHGVARRVIRHLVQAGHEVLVIDHEATRQDLDDLRRWGATYVESSTHRQYTLAAADLDNARAVVCLSDDDLRNVETALLVREASPDVRIVVYTSNASVNRALERIAQPGAVLDVASLSSRSIVDVVVDSRTRAIDIGGEAFIIATVTHDSDSTLRARYEGLAPIAVQPAHGGPLIVCPTRDLEVRAGDTVTLIGTADEYANHGIDVTPEPVARHRGTLGERTRRALAGFVDAFDLPFRVAFGALAVLGVTSVLLLLIGYREPDGTGMSLLDAVYFTAETIGQVGFGDFYFRDQSTWLRAWSIVLILFGILLVAVVTALLTNTLVTRRLAQSLGRQRLTGMSRHVVVIGLGSVGMAVARELRDTGYDVAIIDRLDGNRFAQQARDEGMPVLVGDATMHETLEAAGIERARGVAVLTSDDMVNIEVGLAVRDALGERRIPVALRVFERDLGRVLGRELDIGVTRSTAELAAPWFVGGALGLHIISTFYVGTTPILAAWITVREGGALEGRAIGTLASATRVVAIRRSGEGGWLEHPLDRDAVLRQGDVAYFVGQYEELLGMLERS